MNLTRRQLIRSTLEIAAALGVASISGPALARSPGPHTLTLYDPRFHRARDAAEALAGNSSLAAITGDVTDLASMLLQSTSVDDALFVVGVTAESVPFCLQQLARPPAVAILGIKRLDRDLFIWKLTLGGWSSKTQPNLRCVLT